MVVNTKIFICAEIQPFKSSLNPIGNLPTNCLSEFDHFVKLALKGLICLSWLFL